MKTTDYQSPHYDMFPYDYLCKIQINVILSLTPRSPRWSLSFKFSINVFLRFTCMNY